MKINIQHVIFGGCTLLVSYLVLIPLGMLLVGSIMSAPLGDPGGYITVKNYWEAYLNQRFLPLISNSFLFAIGNSVLVFVLATPLAWIYERTDTPLRKVFAVTALLPFIVPGILSTISWILLLSPKVGLVNIALMKVMNLDQSPLNIYSLYGMIWTEAMHDYPLVFLMVAASLRSMDMALEESATMSGAGVFDTFSYVTLPLMRPAFVSAMLITFIYAIEAFEVPVLVGLPGKNKVFTSEIYQAIHVYPSNFGLAAALSVTLLFFSGLGVYCYRLATAKEERFATVTGKGFRPRVIVLGRIKYVVSGLCIIFFLLTIGLPLFVLLWSSFAPFYGAPSLEGLATLSLKNYAAVFKFPSIMVAFRNSIFLMLTTATLTMLLTSVIGWIVVKSKIRGRGFLDFLTFIPIAFPGIVLGISLIYVYLYLPIPIYGTIWILLVSYMTKYMPFGIRVTSSTMIQIHKDMEEVAALSGAAWGTTFLKITLPLLMPGFIAGWLFIAMVSLRELSTSILLYSSGSQVLSIAVFDLWGSGEYGTLCALGIIMISILILLVFLTNKIGARIGINRAMVN